MQQLFVTVEHLLWNVELHLRQAATRGREHLVCIYNSTHMKNHIVISAIELMAMQIPIGSLIVDFNITHPQRFTDLYLSIEEVGPGITIMQAGVNNLNLLPVTGDKTSEG